jgi:hypothetical protein
VNDLGRTDTVTFLIGKDEARLRELDAEVARTKPDKTDGPRLLTEVDPHTAAVEARQKFAAAAKKRGTQVVMRSVGRKTWRRLLADNPPREGNTLDERLGADSDSFGEAIVAACLASPTFANDEERDAFLDSLSEAQFGRLELLAFELNRGLGADPT